MKTNQVEKQEAPSGIDRKPRAGAWKSLRDRLLLQEDLNFLLTNRIPRVFLTRWMGRFSKIRSPLVARASIAIWKMFTDLDLSEARETRFSSLHECFVRQLRDGARPVDPRPEVLVSPSDGIVGEFGVVEGDRVYQAKGFPYRLSDLFGSEAKAEPYRNGTYVTLRLTSAMYHRFHAPADASVKHVTYISGDTWNVNPIALKRVEKLFCRNERAVIETELCGSDHFLTLVPVAAVLVASIRLHCLRDLLHLRYRGPNVIDCEATYEKGEEMGWFQHGSTIILFAPPGFTPAEGIQSGMPIRMGQALLRLPDANPAQPL